MEGVGGGGYILWMEQSLCFHNQCNKVWMEEFLYHRTWWIIVYNWSVLLPFLRVWKVNNNIEVNISQYPRSNILVYYNWYSKKCVFMETPKLFEILKTVELLKVWTRWSYPHRLKVVKIYYSTVIDNINLNLNAQGRKKPLLLMLYHCFLRSLKDSFAEQTLEEGDGEGKSWRKTEWGAGGPLTEDRGQPTSQPASCDLT